MVERAARIEPYALQPRPAARPRCAATSGERAITVPRSSTCTSPSRWPLADRQLDLDRRDDALDERPLDVDDAEGRLRARRGGRAACPYAVRAVA